MRHASAFGIIPVMPYRRVDSRRSGEQCAFVNNCLQQSIEDCIWVSPSPMIPRRLQFWSAASTCAVIWICGLSIASAETRDSEVVKLPPLVVEEKLRGPGWRYATIPGFEILARCSDKKARSIAHSYLRAYRLSSTILPERFLAHFDVPTKLIFFDENLWPAAITEAAERILKSSPLVPERPPRPAPGAPSPFDRMRLPDPIMSPPLIHRSSGERTVTKRYSETPVFIKDQRLSDDDCVVIFNVVPPDLSTYYRTYLRPSYIARLLAVRTPALPTWFVAGFIDFYQQLEFAENRISMPPMVWVDSDRTSYLREKPKEVEAEMLSLVELLAEDAVTREQRSIQVVEIAAAQLRLFFRWALDPTGGERREAFWSLVERGGLEKVSEQTIAECFGLPASQILAGMVQYLPAALEKEIHWEAEGGGYPVLEFAPAAPAQSARIRGEWERLQASYVQQAAPEHIEQYRSKARRTLRQGYAKDEDDIDLLAVRALCELESGNMHEAAQLLERAVQGGVIRPRAYLELARLKYEALVAPQFDGASLTREEAEPILRNLVVASRQSPKLLDVFTLYAVTLERCNHQPGDDDFSFLKTGGEAFPRSAEMAYRLARLYLAAGKVNDARILLDRAAALGASDAYMSRMVSLRESLDD